MLKIFTVLLLAALSNSAHAITFTGEGCESHLLQITHKQHKYPVATLVSSDELAALMEQHHVELPISNLRPGVELSDRDRARFRNLPAVFPSLINRKLKFQISYDDGQNGHIMGSIRAIDDADGKKIVSISIEGYKRSDSDVDMIQIPAAAITALNGINHAAPVNATRVDLESVRALRTNDRALLGKRLYLSVSEGVLVAANVIGKDGVAKSAVQTIVGRVQWFTRADRVEPWYSLSTSNLH